MKERQINPRRSFVPHDEPAERSEPRDRALDDPAVAVASELPSVLCLGSNTVDSMRADQLDPTASQESSQRVGIVSAIGNQAFRTTSRPSGAAPRHRYGRQCRQNQLYFRRRGRGDGNSQRKTRAVDHHHALRAFAPLGFSDLGAPFFAGAMVPSMNVFSQSRRPRASSSPANARQIRSQTPRSSHRFNRRQHVDGLGYPPGRSRHRAPVFKTHKIPSITARLSIQGRPPLRLRRIRGSSGSILDHCRSVKRILGRGTLGASAPIRGLRPRCRLQG